jgi:tetratricopeptide (TPR) repeat protein
VGPGPRATLVGLLLFALPAPVAADGEQGGIPAAKQRPLAPSIAHGVTKGPAADEARALEELRKEDLELMIRRTRDFSDIVDGMVRHVYEMRRGFIDENYQSKIKAEEELAARARQEAIAYFEAFLKKYPDDPPYTPDAMFRLAELYYDDSYISYLDGLAAFSEAQEKRAADEKEMPEKDFSRTIGLFQELVVRYPDYRNIDGAYYLLGYTLNDTGHEEEARLAWLNLVCANKFTYRPGEKGLVSDVGPISDRPAASLVTGTAKQPVDAAGFVDPFAGCVAITGDSRFFFESWWLIGNYHFDYDTSTYGVETAISAYRKLTEDPQHRFYDRGLYKLAWSYFKADRYPEAIREFAAVVDFADAQVGAKGSGMRPEAVQYLAVCFFTDDWDGDLSPDATSGIERLQDPALMPQDRKWTREVYALLGDIFSENEKHEEAITVWKLFLAKWPLDVQAPFVQDKVADAYNRLRQFDVEIEERTKLDAYGRGSQWWQANEEHPDAQNAVALMARDALIDSALVHHRNAQALRQRGLATQDEEILRMALDEYNLAAEAYRRFIELYPDTPDAYDLNFQMADALFWSGQHEKAKTEYAKVRDSNLDDRHRAEAGNMVIICLERMLEAEVEKGTVVLREEPPELQGEPLAPEPQPLPPLLLELMDERAAFLKATPKAKEAATYEYHAAQTYYRYGHWDEALPRYEGIYDKYCRQDEVSLISWKTLLNVAAEQNNLSERERLALMEQERQCAVAGTAQGDDAIDLGSLLGDVAMQRAMERFKECSETKDPVICTDAGEQLEKAVARAPQHQSADAALHNAALAYENAKRFETAMLLYGRIVNEYPKSRWVDKCLFMQAKAANNFFEYEKALANYKILADEKRFKDSDYREDSIYNVAFILTNLQAYKDAVPYWERFATEVDDPKKSIEARFNAADMQYRAGKWKDAIKAYSGFLQRYDRNREAGPFVVKAAYRAAQAEVKTSKKRKDIIAAWNRTVDVYKRLVGEPGSMSAEYAAECHFLTIEEDMRDFEKFEIKGAQKQIEDRQREGAEKVKSFEERYRQIQQYRRPVWSLAAEFRIGYAYEVYAKAILNIPLPSLDEMMKLAGMSKQEIAYIKKMPKEERDQLQYQIEDKIQAKRNEAVAAMEERAQEEYKIAVKLAREGNISNEWTLLALERMNAYDPDNYPRQHNGIVELRADTVAAPPFAAMVE